MQHHFHHASEGESIWKQLYNEPREPSVLRVLSQVQIVEQGDPMNEHTCGPLNPNQNHRVTVLCAGRKDLEVIDAGNGVIRIEFDHVEYPEVGAGAGRRKFRHPTQQIMGMEIRNSSGTVVHRCRVVPGNRNLQIKISDSHA